MSKIEVIQEKINELRELVETSQVKDRFYYDKMLNECKDSLNSIAMSNIYSFQMEDKFEVKEKIEDLFNQLIEINNLSEIGAEFSSELNLLKQIRIDDICVQDVDLAEIRIEERLANLEEEFKGLHEKEQDFEIQEKQMAEGSEKIKIVKQSDLSLGIQRLEKLLNFGKDYRSYKLPEQTVKDSIYRMTQFKLPKKIYKEDVYDVQKYFEELGMLVQRFDIAPSLEFKENLEKFHTRGNHIGELKEEFIDTTKKSRSIYEIKSIETNNIRRNKQAENEANSQAEEEILTNAEEKISRVEEEISTEAEETISQAKEEIQKQVKEKSVEEKSKNLYSQTKNNNLRQGLINLIDKIKSIEVGKKIGQYVNSIRNRLSGQKALESAKQEVHKLENRKTRQSFEKGINVKTNDDMVIRDSLEDTVKQSLVKIAEKLSIKGKTSLEGKIGNMSFISMKRGDGRSDVNEIITAKTHVSYSVPNYDKTGNTFRYIQEYDTGGKAKDGSAYAGKIVVGKSSKATGGKGDAAYASIEQWVGDNLVRSSIAVARESEYKQMLQRENDEFYKSEGMEQLVFDEEDIQKRPFIERSSVSGEKRSNYTECVYASMEDYKNNEKPITIQYRTEKGEIKKYSLNKNGQYVDMATVKKEGNSYTYDVLEQQAIINDIKGNVGLSNFGKDYLYGIAKKDFSIPDKQYEKILSQTKKMDEIQPTNQWQQ